ncbi:MAG: biotin carboxylase N-terminal domain-containing protein [Deltaproteobacteria bacterium]
MSFTTLLIANRGEIACRIMRSATEMGLRSVAVYTDADADALHVRNADMAVRLPGTYMDSAAILEAAKRTGAGAIHPGYGFLSENAAFAAEVKAAGLAWVGPSPEAITRMGDKIEARKLAEEVGVPTLPGSDDCNAAAAEKIGYPVLVKAAAGGGGKGMRVVEKPELLQAAIEAAQREAKSGFGDDRVFLERYVPRARHIEIQILGDAHGNIVHLGERECSIQRRHQKIIEESPSPRISAELRETMGAAALSLASALHYESAGTVEFLFDDESGEFFFLEVNTRLQVEHPVTEAVTGIDLVREQLRIAAGEELGYAQEDIEFAGAAIEARLYAEDPANDFLPATGTIYACAIDEPDVRWDSGISQGSVVGTDFDPMLAKVIAHAATRQEAAGRLALALERLHLGGVTTNRDFLAATLRTPEFLAGDTTTDFIERVKPARRRIFSSDEQLFAARAAALFVQDQNRRDALVLGRAPSGWRNGVMPPERMVFRCGENEIEVTYRSERDGSFRMGEGARAQVHEIWGGSIEIEIDGLRIDAEISRHGAMVLVGMPGGDIEFELLPRFTLPQIETASGGLTAPMPGKVIEVRVAEGDTVAAGDTLLLLEAMKMEHPIQAPEDGIVKELRIATGDQVENGALLLVVEPTGGES